jgi:hypothetical protein
MSTIAVPLADEDLAFLRAFSAAHGTTAEEFLARQARNLRVQLEKPLPPEVISATGIIPEDFDVRGTYLRELESKHKV